jgi:hypothetical protein
MGNKRLAREAVPGVALRCPKQMIAGDSKKPPAQETKLLFY